MLKYGCEGFRLPDISTLGAEKAIESYPLPTFGSTLRGRIICHIPEVQVHLQHRRHVGSPLLHTVLASTM